VTVPGLTAKLGNCIRRVKFDWFGGGLGGPDAIGMFSTTDLIGPLAQHEITLSSSQVYRLVTERPERPEPEDPDGSARHPGLRDGRPDRARRRSRPGPAASEGRGRGAGDAPGIGALRPKRARITGTSQ
jgi:hypothetical protein